jgi:beta-phosphoglucomutase-like phosphatase (HAD superfamily)
LGVTPEECIVFEDAPKGVEAAERAGMKAVVLTTMHEAHEFASYNNIICFIENYDELSFKDLIH